MQKVIIQGCSLLGLVIILGVASVSAQLSTQYRAEIPFDFSVRDKNFPAGAYSIGPMSSTSSNAGLMLLNKRTGKTMLLGVIQTSGNGRSENGKMYFTNTDGYYSLSEIITPTFTKKVKWTRTGVHIVKAPKPTVFAVKLTL